MAGLSGGQEIVNLRNLPAELREATQRNVRHAQRQCALWNRRYNLEQNTRIRGRASVYDLLKGSVPGDGIDPPARGFPSPLLAEIDIAGFSRREERPLLRAAQYGGAS
jgi:hypothetical protein